MPQPSSSPKYPPLHARFLSPQSSATPMSQARINDSMSLLADTCAISHFWGIYCGFFPDVRRNHY